MVQLLWNTSSTLKYQINTTDLESPVIFFIFLLDARSSCGQCYHFLLVYINLPFLGILTNKTQQNGTSMQYQKGGNSTKLKCSDHSF